MQIHLLFATDLLAREDDKYSHVPDDSLYIKAREAAFNGETGNALELVMILLDRDTLHNDAAVLAGRLFSWEKKYDSAMYYLNKVFLNDTCYYDALAAQIDIEIWEKNFDAAIRKADEALSCFAGDETFLLKKARAFHRKGMTGNANEIVEHLLRIDPDNDQVKDLKIQLTVPEFYYYRENNYLLAGYHGEYFNEPYSRNMHIGTGGYSYFSEWGPVTGKVNFANTFFDGSGLTRYPSVQYEIESYPELSGEGYLFMNYAFSRGSVFPRHRGAFEIYRNLPSGFEASLGFRFLHWDRTYLFYTGSIGKYYADYWFSLRPYIIPGDSGVSASWYFNARKYFMSANDYAGVIVGFGLSPDETMSVLTDRIYRSSTSAGFEISKGLGTDYLIRSSIRYEHEEYNSGSFRGNWIFNMGLRYYL